MTFLAIKLALGSTLAFVEKHKRLFAVLAMIVLLALSAIWLRGCYVHHEQQKVTNDLNNSNSQIFQANTNSQIIEGEKGKRETEVKDAQKQTQPALENVNRSRSNDSGALSDDERAARERFCKTYPGDSKCVQR